MIGKILANTIADKRLISKIHKGIIQIIIITKISYNFINKWTETWIYIFLKITYKWPQAHEKVFNISSSGKCKSKPQWYHLTPTKMAMLLMTCDEYDVKKEILVYCWWKVNWCSPYKTVLRFLKKLKMEVSLDHIIPLLAFTKRKQKH